MVGRRAKVARACHTGIRRVQATNSTKALNEKNRNNNWRYGLEARKDLRPSLRTSTSLMLRQAEPSCGEPELRQAASNARLWHGQQRGCVGFYMSLHIIYVYTCLIIYIYILYIYMYVYIGFHGRVLGEVSGFMWGFLWIGVWCLPERGRRVVVVGLKYSNSSSHCGHDSEKLVSEHVTT